MFKQWEDLASPDCPVSLTGEQVRSARKAGGMTVVQLAKRLGVTRQCIYSWEQTGVDVVRACAIRFAVIYGDCLDEIASV